MRPLGSLFFVNEIFIVSSNMILSFQFFLFVCLLHFSQRPPHKHTPTLKPSDPPISLPVVFSVVRPLAAVAAAAPTPARVVRGMAPVRVGNRVSICLIGGFLCVVQVSIELAPLAKEVFTAR